MVRVLLFATIFLLVLQTGSAQGDLVETLNDQLSPTHRALSAGGDQSTSSRRLTGTKDSEFIRAGQHQQTEGVQVQSKPSKGVEALKAQIMAAVAVEDYHEAAKLKDLLDTLQITPFGSDKTEIQIAAKTAAREAVEQKEDLRGDVPMSKMVDFNESDDDEDEDEWLKDEESSATPPSLRRKMRNQAFNQSSMFWYKDWQNSERRAALARKGPNRATQSLIMLDNENERRNGACPSPPEFGKLSEGLPPGTDPELLKVLVAINAFDMGLSAYEAPIALRFASMIVNTWWNCIAVFSDTFKDAFTNERPGVVVSGLPYDMRRGATQYRADAGAHAVTFMAEQLIDNTVDDVIGGLTSIGVEGCKRGLKKHLSPCGGVQHILTRGATLDLACLQNVVDAAVGAHIRWRNNQCSGVEDCNGEPNCDCMSHKAFTRLIGQVVALQTVAFAIADGWNQLGTDDGAKCDVNCQPFKDTTNFKKGYNDDTKWRPMKEDNGMGFFFQHRHVTPHIGTMGKLRFLSEQDRTDRVAPDPSYDADRKKESDKVILRMNTLDDRKKVQIETFDSKLYTTNMVIAAFLPKCAMQFDDVSVLQSSSKYTPGEEIYCSYERLVHFVISLINSEYDAAIIVWKEKVQHNLVRPTTVIKRLNQDLIGPTWSHKVDMQATSQFKARDFEAYKRVMPHAEYPSGSACMCQTLADSGREYLKKFECGIVPTTENIQITNAPTQYPTNSPTMSPDQMACATAGCQECLHLGKSPSCHSDGKGDSEDKCLPLSNHIWCGDFPVVTQICSVGKHVTAAWPNNGKYYDSTITRIIEEDGTEPQVEVQWDDDGSFSTLSFNKVSPGCSIPSLLTPAIASTSESASENSTPLDSAHGLVNDGSSMTSISMRVARLAPFLAKTSSVEKGKTPDRDVMLEYPSVDEMAQACSQSRLDGGMHFEESVSRGEDLCKGIGNLGVEWAYNLLGVFSDATDEANTYTCATATCSTNHCSDCRTGGCAAGCSYCSQNCVSGSNKW